MNTVSPGLPELLAPAGNPEKLEIAVHYGADAVYLGGKAFSLRNHAGNFSLEEIKAAVTYCRSRGVRLYVACNAYLRSGNLTAFGEYLEALARIKPDALIVADPGAIHLARRHAPRLPLHLSTQAHTTNTASLAFWQNQGITRVNAARELNFDEVAALSRHGKMEIEVFVHGAMCMALSGRCLLSAYMARRDANQGLCAHPCRWRYHLMEEKRPGEFFPVMEDENGSFILSASDLCLLDELPRLIETGVTAIKIEGRMKGIHYLASTVKVYREALDDYARNRANFQPRPYARRLLDQISHRPYGTGFYDGQPDQEAQPFTTDETPVRFAGKVLQETRNGQTTVEVRNKICTGDTVDLLSPRGPVSEDRIECIVDEKKQNADCAHPGSRVMLSLNGAYQPNDLLRVHRPKNDNQSH